MQLGSDAEAVGKSVPNAGRVPASAILLSETTLGGALIDPNKGSNRDEKAIIRQRACDCGHHGERPGVLRSWFQQAMAFPIRNIMDRPLVNKSQLDVFSTLIIKDGVAG